VQVSEGNTATAADVAIYVENSFAYKDRNQSEGRIYREGQKNTTVFIDLVTKGTVDLRILKAIEDGEDLSEAVLLEEMLKGM
jgi:SNF2 family DNA or RNA helicase